MGSIISDDAVSIHEEPGQEGPDQRQDKEANVCSIANGSLFLDVDVLPKRNLPKITKLFKRCGSASQNAYQAANDGSQVEDHPEPTNVFPL
jgi:hypothetical protein